MEMFNPPHPGGILKHDVFPELGLTVTQAAEQIGVDRVTLSRFINEKTSLSIPMAIKIEKWLGKGLTAKTWLEMQLAHDLWQERSKEAA